MNRRTALLGLLAAATAPSLAHAQFHRPVGVIPEPTIDEPPITMSPHPQPAPHQLPYQYRHQPVAYRSQEAPGTIVIDTSDRYLY